MARRRSSTTTVTGDEEGFVDYTSQSSEPSQETPVSETKEEEKSSERELHEVLVQRIIYSNQNSQILAVKFQGESSLKKANKYGEGSIIVRNDSLQGATVEVGERFLVAGDVGQHNNKPQIKVQMINPVIAPDDLASLRKWLAKFVPGIGKAYADKIADYFGPGLADALNDLNVLKIMPGLREGMAEEIYKAYSSKKDYNDLYIYLSSFIVEKTQVLSRTQIDKLINSYGNLIKDIIENNPWQLADVSGIGFLTADKIALLNGRGREDDERIIAGAKHVLKNDCAEKGHTCLPADIMVSMTRRLLDIDIKKIEAILPEILNDPGIIFYEKTGNYYHREVFEYEQGIANSIVEMLKSGPRMSREKAEDLASRHLKMAGFKKDQSQFDAIVDALMFPYNVLTGGPGTGKSTVQNVFVRCLKELGETLSASCPTGQGAKRLSEASNADASTVHRQLLFNPETDEFRYNAENPLPFDRVATDEISMLDVWLGYNQFAAISPKTALCHIGDFHQLASVGAGQLLRDVIMSGLVPVSRLQKTHRQAGESGIPVVASRILNCEMPFKEGEKLRGIEHIDVQDGDVIKNLIDLVTRRFPLMGVNPERDVMILTAQREKDIGVSSNNVILKHLLNPALPNDGRSREFNYPGGKKEGGMKTITMTLGDMIMQLKNNYNHNIFNGDVGTVANFIEVPLLDSDGKPTGKMQTAPVINFKGREVVLDPRAEINKDTVIHANNGTVHKAQGSEAPIVICLIPEAHAFMMTKRLLYTAVTRGKGDAFFIGPKKTFELALTRNDDFRYTGLEHMLTERIPEVENAWKEQGYDPEFLRKNQRVVEQIKEHEAEIELRRKKMIAGNTGGRHVPSSGRVIRRNLVRPTPALKAPVSSGETQTAPIATPHVERVKPTSVVTPPVTPPPAPVSEPAPKPVTNRRPIIKRVMISPNRKPEPPKAPVQIKETSIKNESEDPSPKITTNSVVMPEEKEEIPAPKPSGVVIRPVRVKRRVIMPTSKTPSFTP